MSNTQTANLNLQLSSDSATASANSSPNPFNPESLRIDPASGADLGVKKALLHVPVRKPGRQEFVRTRPEAEFRMPIATLPLAEEREVYAVVPAVAAALPGETRIVELRLCISRTGTLFLWPVPLPTPDGRENAWHKTARDAAELGETQWIRVIPNNGAGCYDVLVAPSGPPEPVWPDVGLAELLQIAFGSGRLIDTVDHPVIKRLRGQ